MKHQDRGVIRVHDKTDHGGEVVSATSGTMIMGKAASIKGDMTYCPSCKGNFAIKQRRWREACGQTLRYCRV
jgi:uncharacterized Zn-binding protein involved in type VI secretion